jgi:hypothetical protein
LTLKHEKTTNINKFADTFLSTFYQNAKNLDAGFLRVADNRLFIRFGDMTGKFKEWKSLGK